VVGRLYPFGALLTAGLLWALGFPLGKLAMREMPAPRVVLYRFLFAAACAAVVLFRGRSWRLLADWRVLAAGVVYGLAFFLQYEGLERIDVSLAALLIGLLPAMLAVAGRLQGERPGWVAWIGVAAVTAGAFFLADVSKREHELWGVLISLAGLVFMLGWTLAFKRLPPQKDGLAVPAAAVVVATLVVAPAAVAIHGAPHLRHPAGVWAMLAVLGASTLLAVAAWQFGSRRMSSAASGVFLTVEPLAGALIGVFLFHDLVTKEMLTGSGLILAGSLAVVFGESLRSGGPAPLKAATG
jgi:drug/metabolite transporter (DMT)-like permease